MLRPVVGFLLFHLYVQPGIRPASLEFHVGDVLTSISHAGYLVPCIFL